MRNTVKQSPRRIRVAAILALGALAVLAIAAWGAKVAIARLAAAQNL